jgi:hypothetical protein
MERQSFSLMLLLFATTASAPAASETVDCVTVRAFARYSGIGYRHIATTRNECARPVRCQLWTDVDPEPQHLVELAPQTAADIVFRIGSPAYEFHVEHRCEYIAP